MDNPAAKEIRNIIHILMESEGILGEISKNSDDVETNDPVDQQDQDAGNDTDDRAKHDPDNQGIEKIEGTVNVQELINLLEIPKEIEDNFRSAMYVIRTSDDPHLTSAQALALATAFDHVLLLNAGKKQKFFSKVRTSSPDQSG